METLLQEVKPVMEKHTGLKLSETYSYARIYKNGDVLARHKDRYSCEISTTLNLGGDPWPIYLDPTGKTGQAGIKVDLKPGDMLIYSGCDLVESQGSSTYNDASFEGIKFMVTSAPTATTITITMATQESGTPLSNTGSATAQCYVNVGPAQEVGGYGWGTGNWSGEASGVATTTLGFKHCNVSHYKYCP